MKEDQIIFWAMFFYIGMPVIFEQLNKKLWQRRFFLINYVVAIFLGTLLLILLIAKTQLAQSRFTFTLLSPLIFLTCHRYFDYVIQKKYRRHFVITNKSISRTGWKFNWLDQVFTVLAIVFAVTIPVLIHYLIV
jgi:hypothetical protein